MMRRQTLGLSLALVCAGGLALLLFRVLAAGPGHAPADRGAGGAGSSAVPIEASGVRAARASAADQDAGSPATRERGQRALLVVRVSERGTGVPIEGACLAVKPASDEGPWLLPHPVRTNSPGEPDARTDAAGVGTVEVSHGVALRLVVSGVPDAGTRMLPVPALAVGERREISVDLPRGLDLGFWARVVSAESGAPVAGARIRLFAGGPSISAGKDHPRKKLFAQTDTDAEGLVHIRVPSWKSVLARVDAEGYGPVLAAIVQGHEESARAQVLRLTRSASLAATVLSSRGAGVPGAQVVLTTPSARIARPGGTSILGNDPEWSAVTDESGRCHLADLPAEAPLSASIRRGDVVLQEIADPVVLAPGEEVLRTWHLGGGAALSGILLDPRSQPLAGVEIWLARAPAQAGAEPGDKYFWPGLLEKPFGAVRTDAQGRFAFADVESGDWWVGPGAVPLADDAPAGASVATRATGVRIPPEVREVEVVLRAQLGLYLRGRVVGPAGAGVAYAFVHAAPEGAAGILSARCGENGAFALGPLAPGAFRLQASGQDGHTDSDPVAARAGDRDVVLKLHAGGVLRGRVVGDEGGAPLSASLLLCSQDEPPRCLRASAGRDATFEFTGVRAGTYDLVARSGDGRVGLVRGLAVAEGAENAGVAVALAPGARLRVRYLGGAPWGRFTVLAGGAVVAVEAVQAGTSSWVGVPAGALVVRFSAGAFAEDRAVEASAAHGETEVVFRSE